ncbi:hypothetical protein NL676_033195 [Syzygium grande]|nr:hypothetical protein NL676_033195 [Syzygium grande]
MTLRWRHVSGDPPYLQFSLHSVSLTPRRRRRRRRRATSDALASASAASDASDERGPPLPTSDIRLLALTPTPPPTSEIRLLALTPTPPPTSSALASDADVDDASDERGPPLPTSDVRRLAPTPTPPPTSDALASDADADASDGRVFFCFPSHRLISHRLI